MEKAPRFQGPARRPRSTRRQLRQLALRLVLLDPLHKVHFDLSHCVALDCTVSVHCLVGPQGLPSPSLGRLNTVGTSITRKSFRLSRAFGLAEIFRGQEFRRGYRDISLIKGFRYRGHTISLHSGDGAGKVQEVICHQQLPFKHLI